MDTPKQEPRWFGNYPKSKRDAVAKAAAESGQSVEWRDHPNELMDRYIHRDDFGSIWSTEPDLSLFWSTLVGYDTDA